MKQKYRQINSKPIELLEIDKYINFDLWHKYCFETKIYHIAFSDPSCKKIISFLKHSRRFMTASLINIFLPECIFQQVKRSFLLNKGKNQHVVQHPNGWAVKGSGNSKATKVTATQKEAISIAQEIARNQESDTKVHGRDGKIRAGNSYGNDPCPPKDQR